MRFSIALERSQSRYPSYKIDSCCFTSYGQDSSSMTIPTLNELVYFKLFGTNATSVDLICILAAASIFWFLHAKKAQKLHVSSRQNNDLFSERSEDRDPLENCKFENVRVTKLLIHPIKVNAFANSIFLQLILTPFMTELSWDICLGSKL